MTTEYTAPNSRFNFKVYSPRWGHHDTYRLDISDDGWEIRHIGINGTSDKRGNPHLYANLDQDGIIYPSGLGIEMELLFEHARDSTLADEDIQARLDRLAKWVDSVNAIEKPDFD